MTQSEKAAGLHHILESTFLAHKKDIQDYAGGHLNPDKLLKVPTKEELKTHVPWKSSRQHGRLENPFERIAETRNNADNLLVDRLGLMKESLLDFSVGTAGVLPSILPKKKKKVKKAKPPLQAIPPPLRPTKSEAKLETFVLSEIAKLLEEKPDAFYPHKPTDDKKGGEAQTTARTPRKKYVLPYTTMVTGVLTEELKLQELMLPAVDESVRVPPSLKDHHPSIKQRVQEITDKKFVTTHFAGITQKDRFSKILDFDRNVLHRYETLEKNVRDGHRAAQHLEQKLVRRLLELNELSDKPYSMNFERLQVYGEVWQDLCADSAIFGPLLSEIKAEYEDYLAHLLDEIKTANHSELVTCLKATEGLSQYTEKDVEEKRLLVEELEEDGRNGLARNTELHKLIAREKEVIEEKRKQKEREEEENRRRLIPIKPTKRKASNTQHNHRPDSEKLAKNTEKVLQELRADIWERLDEISQTQTELKTNYVPKTLHRNALHAVQDTETEMQKLMQQIEYLTKNMKIQEDSLATDLTKFDSVTKEGMEELFSNLGFS